jgi:phospholipid N-methyltransferase
MPCWNKEGRCSFTLDNALGIRLPRPDEFKIAREVVPGCAATQHSNGNPWESFARGGAMHHTIAYLRNFIRDRNVASITPTSPFGVKRVCRNIDFGSSEVIVEYGPGTGVFSNYLLRNMKSDARLILIERNKNFGSILERTILDPRVVLFNDSAENVLESLRSCQESQADYIISGIPFLLLSCELKMKILYNTHRALKKGGEFLVYQTCFQGDHILKIHLERYFSSVRTKFEVRNIPPMRIYEAIK